ncbi:virA/G regulated protein (plasmid) [Agrobacterium tumefaciens]|uniref:VirA/G regulated protein n=2 Tax=Agrobacterium tumefaciens TaxID=358 RepID=A0AAJ4TDP9_AGRTU|nr:virA/G regulated protein [Agrobacterium tumefaciens]
MVSTTKTSVTKSPTTDMRRSAKRVYEQTQKALLTEDDATKKRAKFETSKKQKKYVADMQILDKLDAGVRGEISYKLLGNKRLRIDSTNELTREHGVLRKTRKILKRNAETGHLYLSLHERKTWRSIASHQYAEDGTLRTKHVKQKDGRFEEKWERDESGRLIRTRYVNRGRLSGRLFQPVSEEMSAPYRSGPEKRLYRELTRQKGSRQETFERDDNGNLELIGCKRLGFSMNLTKAVDRQTSQTKIRKLGGAFSKSYRSLLDKEGNELGRDISSHRRLFNKRSALYDDVTGQLKGTKHTFGKIYKSETAYLNTDVKKVSKKILGVTVDRKLTALSGREYDAQRLRALESTQHKQAWQERAAIPRSSQRETANIYLAPQLHLTNLVGNGIRDQAETKVTCPHQAGSLVAVTADDPVNVVGQTSPLVRGRRLERRFGFEPPFPRPEQSSEAPGLGRLERKTELGLHGVSSHQLADLQSSICRTHSKVLPPVSSSPNHHLSDPESQELLSFLHSAPGPHPLVGLDGIGGHAERNLDGAFGDPLVPTSSVSERLTCKHLERSGSINKTNTVINPQSLFGEPDLTRLSGSWPESPSRGDHLSDSEQQALLNELHGIPLPAPLQKPDTARSNISEGSRSRQRSASGGFSL